MKPQKNIRIKVRDSGELKILRNTIDAMSDTMNFNYRIRERQNKNGRYASVTINNTKS